MNKSAVKKKNTILSGQLQLNRIQSNPKKSPQLYKVYVDEQNKSVGEAEGITIEPLLVDLSRLYATFHPIFA